MPRRYEDDEDDDRPRRRRRDDEDDDRPQRRTTSGSGIGVVIAVGVFGLLGLFAAIGVIAFVLLRGGGKDEPEVAEEQPAPAEVQQPDNRPGEFPGLPAPRPGIPQPPAPKPKDNTPPPPKKGTPPKKATAPTRPGVTPIPTINPLVTGLVFGGGGTDGPVAVVAYQNKGVGQTADVVKPRTGEVLGRVETPLGTDETMALSPDGRWFVASKTAGFEGNPLTLYSVADGKEAGRFTPYPKSPETITKPNLVWAAFAGNDLLLTVNEGGGFDTWTVPGFKHAGGIKPTLTGGQRIGSNGFTKSPDNFAHTPGGKLLAIFNGGGFSFYDVTTAKELARTEDVTPRNLSAFFAGAALTPDGKRFACYYRTFERGNNRSSLTVWITQTGQRQAGGPVPDNTPTPAGFAWWGPRHVLFWQGGISTADVFDTETGQVAGRLQAKIPGKLGTVPPDDKVWGVTGGSLFTPETGAAFLVTDHPPKVIGPKASFEITPDGLRQNDPRR